MPKSKQTAIHPDESESDGFDELQCRFLSLTSRLEVLSQAFYNAENQPSCGITPAVFVLRETTEEMVRLQEDVEGWHSAHEHTPKAKEVQS